MHGSGAVADPEEARRSGEDQSARRAQFGQAVARGGIDSGLGSGCAARGDAGSGAGARGCCRRPQIQTPAGFVVAATAPAAVWGGRKRGASATAVTDWSLAEVVRALMAVRGLDLISATIFLAEIGDLSRFTTPRQLMAYLGLVPGEESTGGRVWRGGITKAGNHRARRILVECSWSYRHPPRVGKKKLAKVGAAPPAVQEIAWKAQARPTGRYRALAG